MTLRPGLWTLSIFIATVCMTLMLTCFRASTMHELYADKMMLQQENMNLRFRLSLYLADPNTQSYLDRWICSQAVKRAEHEKRIRELERERK